MWKILIIILLFFVAIGIFFMLSYRWSEQQLGLYLPQGNPLNPESQEKIESMEFTSPDKDFKLDYSSDWKEIKEKKALEEIYPKELKEKYNLDILLFAQRLKEESLSQLFIVEGYFDNEEGFEKIIKIMQETNQEKGWTMEIVESEIIEDNINIIEAIYSKTNYNDLHSKEQIILIGQEERKAYIISLVVNDNSWSEFEEEANNIISSIQLID